MKRHGFGGQPASHGQSLMHRGMGSAGGSQGSGSRVLPGKRMPGNMGNESVTVKNLRVLQIDEQNGIVVVNGKKYEANQCDWMLTPHAGCVPGPKNQIIRVQDARGKPWPAGPMSTAELKPTEVLAEAGVPDATEATASA
jgi:large subunit ribosomal protein L3